MTYIRRFKKTEGAQRIRAVSLNKDVEYIINIWHRNKDNNDNKIIANFIGCGKDLDNLSPIVPKMKDSSGGKFLFFKNNKETYKFEIKNGASFTTNLTKNKRVTFSYDENAYRSSYEKEHKDLESYKYDLDEDKSKNLTEDQQIKVIKTITDSGYKTDKIFENVENFVADQIKDLFDIIPKDIVERFCGKAIYYRSQKETLYDMNDHEFKNNSNFDFFTYLAYSEIRKQYLTLSMEERSYFIRTQPFYDKVSFKQVDTWIKNSTIKKYKNCLEQIKDIEESIHVYDDENGYFIPKADNGQDTVRELFSWIIVATMNNSHQRVTSQYKCFKTVEFIMNNV